MNLFQESKEPIILNLPDADITYYPAIYNLAKAQNIFEELYNNTVWQQDDITIFGKTHAQPRLTALYANNTNSYSYSGITMHPTPFSPLLQKIKTTVEQYTHHHFTTCLLNLYRNEQDSNGWHADNEKELGINPIIASLSFGAPRWFHLKHRNEKQYKAKILLEPGSLLVMKGTTQQFWLHQIPKKKISTPPRINLTFRTVL